MGGRTDTESPRPNGLGCRCGRAAALPRIRRGISRAAARRDYAKVLQPGELRDVDLYQMEQQLLSLAQAHLKDALNTQQVHRVLLQPADSGGTRCWSSCLLHHVRKLMGSQKI